MAETASGFVESPARSAIRMVHVLLQGTHWMQQHFGDSPQNDMQFSIVGITNVSHLTPEPLGNTSDEFEKIVKLPSAEVGFRNRIQRYESVRM